MVFYMRSDTVQAAHQYLVSNEWHVVCALSSLLSSSSQFFLTSFVQALELENRERLQPFFFFHYKWLRLVRKENWKND